VKIPYPGDHQVLTMSGGLGGVRVRRLQSLRDIRILEPEIGHPLATLKMAFVDPGIECELLLIGLEPVQVFSAPIHEE